MELMFQPLVKYADFEGRARRSEYWLFHLLLWVVFTVGFIAMLVTAFSAGSTDSARGPMAFAMVAPLFGIAVLGVIVPQLAVLVRRIHDTGNSGWWVLIAFVPFLGAVVLFVFSLIDGTEGPNRYGPDPKGRLPLSGMAGLAGQPPVYSPAAPGSAGEFPPIA